MAHTRDFPWTWADQQAGFPQLHAAFDRTATEVLCATYCAQMRDGLTGLFRRNMQVLQNELARALLARGVTHIPHLCGPITITDQW